MKREEIKAIFPDATKEQLDQIMSINGTDVNAAKGELESLRGQLTAAQQRLSAFGDKDPGELLNAERTARAAIQKELDGLKAANSLRELRETVAAEKKIPAALLTGETKEACEKQADAILAFAKPGGYPNLPDGGEPAGGTNAGGKTRDQFATWAEEMLG